MWGKDRGVGFHSNNTTLIARGTTIEGNVSFEGNLEIEGRVIGNIIVAGDSHGTVRILEQGIVEGEIRAPSVVINGTVQGDVHSNDHIELAAKAAVSGDVYYHLLEMVKGAQVNGGLVYSGSQIVAKEDAPMLTDRFEDESEADVMSPILD